MSQQAEVSKINQVQIGLFGKRNSGKSALINALLGKNSADVKTTTEPIYKAMDIRGIGSVMIVDTAGIDAGAKTTQQTQEAAAKIDVALMVISNDSIELELAWINRLMRSGTVVIPVVSKIDKQLDDGKQLAAAILEASGKKPVRVSAKKYIGIDDLRNAIIEAVKK